MGEAGKYDILTLHNLLKVPIQTYFRAVLRRLCLGCVCVKRAAVLCWLGMRTVYCASWGENTAAAENSREKRPTEAWVRWLPGGGGPLVLQANKQQTHLMAGR